jgi:hypothetical protein
VIGPRATTRERFAIARGDEPLGGLTKMPPRCIRLLGEVGKRERKKLCQLSVIILTSAARFSSVSGPEIWREV